MSSLLSGLESLGLGDFKEMKVYGEIEKKGEATATAEVPKEEKKEEDYLFMKQYLCPV